MQHDTTVTPQTVFAVSGGARGITARCVIELARAFHCRFVLIGRSAFGGDEPEWARGCDDARELKQRIASDLAARGERAAPAAIERAYRAIEAQREIARTLQEIEAAGGRAVYVSADISDTAALGAALARGAAALGPISGIIHGAGVLADRRIEQKTVEDFETVYRAKIGGLEALLACVPAAQLRFLALFSSAAGFYGNIGQADYALANEILNKFAHAFQRANPHCRVVAFDWGPWDGGMVTPALKQLFAQRRIDVIPIDEGAAIFVDALRPGRHDNQLVVGSPMIGPGELPERPLRIFRIHRRLRLADNPILDDHVIGGNPVLPTAFAVAWMAGAAEQLAPGLCCTSCDDLHVLKGLVFDGTQAEEYLLEIAELSRDSKAGVLAVEAKISSANADGRTRYHYNAHLTLRRDPLDPSPPVSTEGIDAPVVISGDELYSDGTLFHGPHFQGIEAVTQINEQGLTMRLDPPRIPPGELGQFSTGGIDPILIDMAVQGLVVWARRYTGYASLPLAAGSIEYYGATPQGPLVVRIEIRRRDSMCVAADIVVADRQGRVCMRVVGAEVTLSPRLNERFESAARRVSLR
jgi:NAD(P)-dependent dehydrogenase (short-subunit alcohol dehydrogenase family)